LPCGVKNYGFLFISQVNISILWRFAEFSWFVAKIKLCVNFRQVDCSSGFQVASLAQHKTPNTACTRLVGVGAFSSSFRGFELVRSKWHSRVPPTSG